MVCACFPSTQLLATILGALIAFAAPGGKTAVRADVILTGLQR